MSGSSPPDSDDDLDEEPSKILESADKFISYEQYIIDLFEEVSDSHIRGDSEKARQKLRKFGSEHPKVLRIIKYTLQDFDEFFEDVQEHRSEAVFDRFNSFQRQFSDLGREVSAVLAEVDDEQKSPLTSYDTNLYQTDNSGGPLVSYRAKSGESILVDTRVTFPHFAFLGGSIFEALDLNINDLDDYKKLEKEEQEEVLEALDACESHIENIREALSEMDGQVDETDLNGGAKDG